MAMAVRSVNHYSGAIVMDETISVRSLGQSENDQAFKQVAGYAAQGWKLVRLHGVAPDGRCTCGNGECRNPGKHPDSIGKWQLSATDEEEAIAEWFEDEGQPLPNVGLLLGEESGVVDVEFDDDEGRATLKRLGLINVDTPTYRSSRGEHRLFRVEPGLPATAVVKVHGLEIRLGGGGKAAQSVVPPSRRAQGGSYEWAPGKSPDDCPPAPFPKVLKDLLAAPPSGDSGGARGCVRESREALAAGEKIGPGGRHAFLLGRASELARQQFDLEGPSAERTVLQTLRALNEMYCVPPKPDDEVCRLARDQVEFYRAARRSGLRDLESTDPGAQEKLAAAIPAWERFGLERVKVTEGRSEWRPGRWRLRVRHGDPTEYLLSVFSPLAGVMIDISLTADDWLTPASVARRILASTGDVDVMDPNPGAWSKLWLGFMTKDQGMQVRGLKSWLLSEPFVTHEQAPAEEKRFAVIAGWLLSRLRQVERSGASEETRPSPSGEPKWLLRGGRLELWFQYRKVLDQAAATFGGKVTEADVRALGRRIRPHTGETVFKHQSWTPDSGIAINFMKWGPEHIEALERLTQGDC